MRHSLSTIVCVGLMVAVLVTLCDAAPLCVSPSNINPNVFDVVKRNQELAKAPEASSCFQHRSMEPTYGPITSLPGYGTVKQRQHAGYVTVTNSSVGTRNIFYWFFEKDGTDPAGAAAAPTCVWLQGGPGGSSLYGLFVEHIGPYSVPDEHLKLRDNPHSWTKECNLLIVDQPVGTGFSYTNYPDGKGYCSTEEEIAADMLQFFQTFYQRYSAFSGSPLFILGESYAGKYIPAIAYHIQQTNINSTKPIPLRGVAIGDGWTKPASMTESYLQFGFATGLIDEKQHAALAPYSVECTAEIDKKEYAKANGPCNKVFDDIMTYAGNPDPYDIRRFAEPPTPYLTPYLAREDVKAALHANHVWGSTSDQVGNALNDDIMKPIPSEHLTSLLNDQNLRVFIYNGQFDLICNLVGVEALYYNLPWKFQSEYHSAERNVWHVNDAPAGYTRRVHNFTQIIVHGAGHMVPMDQPAFAVSLVQHLLSGAEFK